ncbi:MAG: penicillin-binding protein 2 [Fusobacteriaceae bacterium]
MKKIKNSKMFMKLGSDHSSKTTIFKIAVVIIFLILAFRMVYLQIFRYEKYKNMSEENRIKLKRIEPDRGKIYDKNGVLLATNGSGYRLIYLKERKYSEDDLKRISQLTGFSAKVIEKRIKNGEISPYTRENILFENLEEKLAHKIIEKIKPEDFIDIQIYSKRRYIYDSLGSHILGYVKKISSKEYETLKEEGYTARDSIGKDGIEKNYDKLLKGKSGFEKIEVNAYNRLQRKIDKQLPEPGIDVYLTIDYEIQNYMEKLLEEEKLTGSFIAVNPKNGEVLALVSYPTYSLNTFSSQISQEEWDAIRTDTRRPLSNKAIAGEYPPGSIFKPISAFAYLSKGVNPNQKYFDPGYYSIGSWTWKAWKVGGHGYVDMKKSIIESVNPYYYRFADQFGYKPILDFALMFGLNEKTGIDIPGEKKGVIPSPEWKKATFNTGWYKGDSVNMSIGQGYVTVTPIQMAQAYSFLANRGKIYQPHLINSTWENGEKKAIERKLVTEVELPSSYFDLMDDALRRTVSDGNGTTTILRTQGLEIGAKSGSAQNSQSKISHAWVAGYFPIKNPEIVFVALLEGAGGGGKIGGGVAKKFVDKYLEIKNRDKEIKNKEIE